MRRASVTSLLLLLAAPISPGAAASPDRGEALDEVLVKGLRLNDVRQQMVQLEERFFALYNELNTIDDFDTYCHIEARIGTKLKGRFCRAVFEDRAHTREAEEYALFLQRGQCAAVLDPNPASQGQRQCPVFGGPPPPAIMAIEARRKEYRQNMLDATSRHPELATLARERYELGQRYEAARRKAFGMKASSGEEGSVSTTPDGDPGARQEPSAEDD